MSSQYSVTDTRSKRETRFEGDVLAHVSTNRPGRARWSELTIFKTVGGSYILVKAGKSILYHATRACDPRTGRYFVETRGDDRKSGIPCLKCGPGPYDEVVFEENDLVTVVVNRHARGLVESAHILDDDQELFLPRIAKSCLEMASDKDPDIAEAYRVEVVA
uniref:Uncharacterized protein n=1 Tax=Micrococcus phage Kurnik TaxID=3092208 RepID=A0AAU6R5K6_9CAUD